jgi:2-keto-4-pentenoate hydratase
VSPGAIVPAIGAVGVALEIVGVGSAARMHEVIAKNVFHRAAVFGRLHNVDELDSDGQARLEINGVQRETTSVNRDLRGPIVSMAQQLDAVGEQLRAGNRIICGSLTQVPVQRGDRVTAGIANLVASRSS